MTRHPAFFGSAAIALVGAPSGCGLLSWRECAPHARPTFTGFVHYVNPAQRADLSALLHRATYHREQVRV